MGIRRLNAHHSHRPTNIQTCPSVFSMSYRHSLSIVRMSHLVQFTILGYLCTQQQHKHPNIHFVLPELCISIDNWVDHGSTGHRCGTFLTKETAGQPSCESITCWLEKDKNHNWSGNYSKVSSIKYGAERKVSVIK